MTNVYKATCLNYTVFNWVLGRNGCIDLQVTEIDIPCFSCIVYMNALYTSLIFL